MNEEVLGFLGIKLEKREEYAVEYVEEMLAAALHCSVPAVSGYETGRNDPNLDMLIAMARFYGVSTDYLLGLTVLPNPAYKLRMLCKGYPLSRFLLLMEKLSARDRAFLAYELLEKLVDRQEL